MDLTNLIDNNLNIKEKIPTDIIKIVKDIIDNEIKCNKCNKNTEIMYEVKSLYKDLCYNCMEEHLYNTLPDETSECVLNIYLNPNLYLDDKDIDRIGKISLVKYYD